MRSSLALPSASCKRWRNLSVKSCCASGMRGATWRTISRMALTRSTIILASFSPSRARVAVKSSIASRASAKTTGVSAAKSMLWSPNIPGQRSTSLTDSGLTSGISLRTRSLKLFSAPSKSALSCNCSPRAALALNESRHSTLPRDRRAVSNSRSGISSPRNSSVMRKWKSR